MKNEIKQLLNETSLSDKDKLTIRFLVESIENNKIDEFNDKTFLFGGEPGIGKTYFIEHLAKLIGLPILFVGPFKLEYKQVKHLRNFKSVLEELEKTKECVVLIDDIQNSIEIERDGMGEPHLADSEGKCFIKILEHIKRTNERKYLFMTLNDSSVLEESWTDRIETRIDLEEPKEKSKKDYLVKKYSKYISKELAGELSMKTIGYNFRNLDELIRLAYRDGNGKITRKSLIKSINEYTPTSLEGYNILRKSTISFKDVVGNDKLKRDLAYLKCYIKSPSFFSKRGIQSSNVLMFAGPPGCGKTHMAKALAGELNVPLINIDGKVMLGRGIHIGINRLVNLSRKFRNCIIFVDELDKTMGVSMLSEDNDHIGFLESEIDGIKDKLQAIVIFTMNNKLRFGSAFHDRIPCFNFDYPEEDERRAYISRKVEKSKIEMSEDLTTLLVKETQKRSYRQMERIWNNILFKLMEKAEYNLKGDRIIVEPGQVEESVKEVIGFVSQTRIPSGIG